MQNKLNKTKTGFTVLQFDNNFNATEYQIHPDYPLESGEHWDNVEFELVEGYAKILEISKQNINTEIKAEDLIDNFISKWRKERNTEDAIYAAYHYDAMVAFAEMYYNLKSNQPTT